MGIEAERVVLGEIDCPVCGGAVLLKLTKKNLCGVTHNNCCQIFARSDDADARLRARLKPASAAAVRAEVAAAPLKQATPAAPVAAAKKVEKGADPWAPF